MAGRCYQLRTSLKNGGVIFVTRLKPLHRTMVLLLKLGIDYPGIKAIPLDEANGLLEAYEELITPPTKTKKYKVRKTP